MTGRRAQIKVFLLIMLMLLCAVTQSAFCEDPFQVRRIGKIHPYEKNAFEVFSDEEGILTIRIHDNICI